MFPYISPFVLLMHLVYLQDFMHKTKRYYLKTMCCVSFHMCNQINVDYIHKEELPHGLKDLRDISFIKKIFSNQNGLYYLAQFFEEKYGVCLTLDSCRI